MLWIVAFCLSVVASASEPEDAVSCSDGARVICVRAVVVEPNISVSFEDEALVVAACSPPGLKECLEGELRCCQHGAKLLAGASHVRSAYNHTHLEDVVCPSDFATSTIGETETENDGASWFEVNQRRLAWLFILIFGAFDVVMMVRYFKARNRRLAEARQELRELERQRQLEVFARPRRSPRGIDRGREVLRRMGSDCTDSTTAPSNSDEAISENTCGTEFEQPQVSADQVVLASATSVEV
eukprot:TRINITY_DN34339_c1_g1_i3.p1 TRINITY_DN34339_c1_g1~~TRINITY_DN34339_c1_g1_i3.p1  ORF type:complete len:242 (+),score=23.62 TRINITY_DN34339_c1_g1_i3:106-831(+)